MGGTLHAVQQECAEKYIQQTVHRLQMQCSAAQFGIRGLVQGLFSCSTTEVNVTHRFNRC